VIISITHGTGKGPTPVAAFDAALTEAGIANYNLIYLSSIIPDGSVLRRAKYVTPEHEYGYRLYVVMARCDVQQPGQPAWAGIGWVQVPESGCGLFVEVSGATREQVENDIHTSLASMRASRPQCYGAIESEVAGITCQDQPVCALVIAVYKSVSWDD
jgi:arginine decarboxylase